jgi:hypothetical protein
MDPRTKLDVTYFDAFDSMGVAANARMGDAHLHAARRRLIAESRGSGQAHLEGRLGWTARIGATAAAAFVSLRLR